MLDEHNDLLNADIAELDPENDKLGYAPLAESIAAGICTKAPREGFVLAIAGSWGSGKTTMVNFIQHYVKNKASDIEIASFCPWWFSGHEDIVRKLFEHLEMACGTNDKRRKKLGKYLGELGKAADAFPIDLKPGIGGLSIDVKKLINYSAAKLSEDKTIPALKNKIGEEIRNIDIRFLVIIDDVDRLSSTEIIDLFRAIKAIGNLPNITYLIALDRTIVSEALEKHFPGRGTDYLEKIIQTTFDLPPISEESMHKLFFDSLDGIISKHTDTGINRDRLELLYNYGIKYNLKTPRHALRLLNTLQFTLPALIEEVSISDFVALESIRLGQPEYYKLIARSKSYFAGEYEPYLEVDHDDTLLHFHKSSIEKYISEEDRDWVTKFIEKLFPKVSNILSKMKERYNIVSWRNNLYACSPDIFDIYFKYAILPGMISNKDIRTLSMSLGSDSAHAYLHNQIQLVETENSPLLELLNRMADQLTEISDDNLCWLAETISELWDDNSYIVDKSSTIPNFNSAIAKFIYAILESISAKEKLLSCLKSIIKKQASAPIMLRIVITLSTEHSLHSEASTKQKPGSKLLSKDEFDSIAIEFNNNIMKTIELNKIADILVLARVIRFFTETKSDKIELLYDRLMSSKIGKQAIIFFSCEELIPVPDGHGSLKYKYLCRLEKIPSYVDLDALASFANQPAEPDNQSEPIFQMCTSFLKELEETAHPKSTST